MDEAFGIDGIRLRAFQEAWKRLLQAIEAAMRLPSPGGSDNDTDLRLALQDAQGCLEDDARVYGFTVQDLAGGTA